MSYRQTVFTIALLAAPLAAFGQAPRYLYMFHNINSFIPPSDQKLAVEAYRGIEDVAKRNGVPLEPFFTGLSFEMYLR
ncbi:MAG: hypothetical protein GY953_15195, partial [bacterium]|nr:hypothetical protein [bacterium]